jgi:putative tricarboxylic transport membrane protein
MTIDDILNSLAGFFTPETLLFLLLGTTLGMVFGILPGLSGGQVLALLLPLTFVLEPQLAIALLMGAMGAVPTGASLTAILINTPGTSSNAATMFDGHPLAKMGRAGEAIAAASFSSMLGGIFGAIVLTALLPVGQLVVLAFSYPETFMLAVLGLAMIAVLSPGSLARALVAAALGLLVAFIGFDPVTGSTRFVFGSMDLWDGIPLVPAMIGLFAISEAINMLSKRGAIADMKIDASYRGTGKGIRAVFQHFRVFLEGSFIGTVIGLIPGVGGTVSNFVAYGRAASTKKNPGNFGKGDIRGVIAPEAANNAKDGGALVPTLFFGIPGGVETAVLLSALMIYGIQPGPRMMLDNPQIVLQLIYALVIANVIAAAMTILASPFLTKLTGIKAIYMAPVIVALSLVGAFATEGRIFDVIVAVVFGVIGYLMHRFDFSRVAFIIALILGGLMETSFHQTMTVFGPAGFVSRPIALGLLLVTILMFALPSIRKAIAKRKVTVHS